MLLTGRQLPIVPHLDALTELVRWRPGLFLRQSRGPDSDLDGHLSIDHESGLEMPGLSVTTITPEPWWTRPAVDWIARRVTKYAHLSDQPGRQAWLLSGRVVGHGPDHEPLVTGIEPVAWLDPAVVREARAHYRTSFDVAQDSTG